MAELKELYAGALFELSMESTIPERYMEQAVSMREILKRKECESFLVHPHVPDKAKRAFLHTLFADKVESHLMGFLYFAISKNRETLIIPALSAYIDMGNRQGGKVAATVVSAVPLREEQLSQLHAVLVKKLNKQVKISQRVDSALIGGFYVHVDGRLIDRTVRTQLRDMRESIVRGHAG